MIPYTNEQVERAVDDIEKMCDEEWLCPLLSIMANRPMGCVNNCAWNNKGTCAVYKLSMLEAIYQQI